MSIQAIKIDAQHQSIKLVTMENTLLDFYRHIGCNIMEAIHPRTLNPMDRLYVDEEGLSHDRIRYFFTIEGFAQPLAGNGLIVGHDAEGEAVDSHTPLVRVKQWVTFLGRRFS